MIAQQSLSPREGGRAPRLFGFNVLCTVSPQWPVITIKSMVYRDESRRPASVSVKVALGLSLFPRGKERNDGAVGQSSPVEIFGGRTEERVVDQQLRIYLVEKSATKSPDFRVDTEVLNECDVCVLGIQRLGKKKKEEKKNRGKG